jgi:pteridine reductase
MDKAALITGAADRIGGQMALYLAREGYSIALHYHSSHQKAAETAGKIRESGVSCTLFKADLAKKNQAQKLIPQVKKKHPQLQILINNASTFRKKNMLSTDWDFLEENLAIHLKSPHTLIREYARNFDSGLVVNMLDTMIARNTSQHAAYLISKKALHNLTLMAAEELAPEIRVNAIAPGITLPPKKAGETRKKQLKAQGSVNEILNALKYFIDHDYITGETLFLTG